MKRIVLLNSYSWYEKGDFAIVLGTLRMLERMVPGAQITIVSATSRVDAQHLDRSRVEVIADPLWNFLTCHRRVWSRYLALFGDALAIVAALVCVRIFRVRIDAWCSAHVRRFVDSLLTADYAISCGGDFWGDGARKAMFVHLFEVACADLARVPVVCLGQSMGPIANPAKRRLARWILNRAAVIVLRERESFAFASAMHMDLARVHLGPDLAFALFNPCAPRRVRLERRGPVKIGVTARSWLFPASASRERAQQAYEEALAAALDRLVEELDAEIHFLPQVINPPHDDDRVVQRRIADRLTHPGRALLMEEDMAPEELVAYVGQLDLVIGTRLHSGIFALLAGVPVVVIGYHHKSKGIFEQVGLEDWVIPIEDVTPSRLHALARRLLARGDEAAACARAGAEAEYRRLLTTVDTVVRPIVGEQRPCAAPRPSTGAERRRRAGRRRSPSAEPPNERLERRGVRPAQGGAGAAPARGEYDQVPASTVDPG